MSARHAKMWTKNCKRIGRERKNEERRESIKFGKVKTFRRGRRGRLSSIIRANLVLDGAVRVALGDEGRGRL